VSELLSENASSNLVSNFSHQIFLVKIVRLLGVVFQDFHQIGSLKNYFDEATKNALITELEYNQKKKKKGFCD
jgi:hypothetical protein